MKVRTNPPALPLFTKLANAQTQDMANAECVAVIQKNYMSTLDVGLETALYMCWKSQNPYGVRAVFELAQKVKKMDRMENLMRDLREKWIMWMGGGGNEKSLLPLYVELHLDNNPTNLYKTSIAGYRSYLSMWEKTSPTRMLVEALDFIQSPEHPPLPAVQTMEMMGGLIRSFLSYKDFAKIVDMLQPQGYPKELSDFLTKNSDLVINENFVAVLMRAPNHSLWESMGVWTTCMMSGNSVHLDHLAMSLSATVYEGYKKFGEKLLVNSINECAWNQSLSKRQALDDAQVLNDQTVTVESPQRQHRL